MLYAEIFTVWEGEQLVLYLLASLSCLVSLWKLDPVSPIPLIVLQEDGIWATVVCSSFGFTRHRYSVKTTASAILALGRERGLPAPKRTSQKNDCEWFGNSPTHSLLPKILSWVGKMISLDTVQIWTCSQVNEAKGHRATGKRNFSNLIQRSISDEGMDQRSYLSLFCQDWFTQKRGKWLLSLHLFRKELAILYT